MPSCREKKILNKLGRGNRYNLDPIYFCLMHLVSMSGAVLDEERCSLLEEEKTYVIKMLHLMITFLIFHLDRLIFLLLTIKFSASWDKKVNFILIKIVF